MVVALNAWVKVSVLVAKVAVTARKAQAPTGRGSNTSPRMVVAKMARRLQPWVETGQVPNIDCATMQDGGLIPGLRETVLREPFPVSVSWETVGNVLSSSF